MNKLTAEVNTPFYLTQDYSYELENIENPAETIIYYTDNGSPWLSNLEDAEEWVESEEALRLQGRTLSAPNTKWRFIPSTAST